MSRSGYSDDYDNDWQAIMWRGAVNSAIKGRRGQAFLKEMLAALDAMPEKRLITKNLEHDGAVCAIGAVGKARGVYMSEMDPEDYVNVACTFGIADAMVREITWVNDEGHLLTETPEQRYERVRRWVEWRILK